MTRMSGKWAALAVAMVLISGALAQAAIIGTATLVRDPPATLFTAPDAALGAPWVAYRLSLTADGGDTIQAVDANITGQLHQRWTSSNVDGTYDTSTGNSTNQTNGDSHFMAITAGSQMLFANGPNEDNDTSTSPLSPSNNDGTGWGVGTTMSATFGPAGLGLTSMNVAYIVVPKGSEPNLDIRVNVFNPTGDPIASLDEGSFFGPQVEAPIVDPLNLINPVGCLNCTVGGTVLLNPASDPADSWSPTASFVSYTPGFGAPGDAAGLVLPATWNPLTQAFSWNTGGSTRGTYVWNVSATNAGGTGTGVITVEQHAVPEPASFALLGLALVGFAGFRRK